MSALARDFSPTLPLQVSRSQPPLRIAVIGGGAASAIQVGELLRRHRGALSIDWYAGCAEPGRGVAYGTAHAHHLLNVRAAAMGLFADDSGGFLNYLHARGMDVAASDFVPRQYYGDYLQHAVQELIATAATNAEVRVHHESALALDSNAHGDYTITDSLQIRRRTDAVVLALGVLAPRVLPGVSAAALDSGRYIVNAWESPPRTSAETIVVIGTGLTAIDTILTLSRRYPQARIIAISRHGHLPGVHPEKPSAPYPKAVDLLAALKNKSKLRDWVRELRTHTRHAADWRSVIDAVRPITQVQWQRFDLVERRRFLRHLRTYWEIVRHRVPHAIAEQLAVLQASGQLTIQPARVVAVDADRDQLRVEITPRGSHQRAAVNADLVFQGVGLDTDVRSAAHPLLQHLLQHGHASADPLGLGLHTSDDGRLRRSDGNDWPNIWLLGPLLRGSVWECTAIPEIRSGAIRIAQAALRADHALQKVHNIT